LVSQPIADATHRIAEIAFLVTRIHLANGVTGESNLLAFDYSPNAIAGALRDIAPLAREFKVWETGRFLTQAFAASEYFGSVGLNKWAAGAINVAMWDAWGKTLRQPVWKMLGAWRESVPVYGSGGWLSYSLAELVDEVTRYARRGFGAVKIKVGAPELEQDLERLARVREAVGPRLKIMMDANQGMTVATALELAQKAARLDIHWFEEPIARTDFDGYEYLRRRAGVLLAMGEREFDTVALRELARRNALDLWQPDLLRLGGVEGWRESALLAHGHGLPVLPHYYKEYDVPLLCTVPNAYGCESFDWIDGLVDQPIVIRDGIAQPLPGPGWGFRFKDEHLHPL
jgi:L-alanine-DL-glutamate epimerase-like enolase superfamily enzyme